MNDIGVGSVVPLMVIAAIWWAQSDAKRPSRVVAGYRIVEYPQGLRLLSLLAFSLVTWLCVKSLLGDRFERIFLGYGMLPFALGSAALSIEYWFSRIEYSERDFRAFSIWRGRRVASWSSVEQCGGGLSFWFYSPRCGKVRFNQLMRGYARLLREMRQRRLG